MSNPQLHKTFAEAVKRYPDCTAVVEPGEGNVTYQELDRLSDKLRDYLRLKGIQKGDRVGICMRKSIDTVATIYGILKAGAVYVPVDASAPLSRNAYIMHNCEVKVIVTERRFEEKFASELSMLAANPEMLFIDKVGKGIGLQTAIVESKLDLQEADDEICHPNDLAYILYIQALPVNRKGCVLRMKMQSVSWIGARKLFSQRSQTAFHLMLLFISICQFWISMSP